MKKSFSMIVIAALLLAGCSKSELTDREPSGALIKARSAFPGVTGEATRAPYIGDISSDNELVARVLTSKDKTNYAGEYFYANGKMTFKGSGAVGYDPSNVSGEVSFPIGIGEEEVPYYLVGLYPYEGEWGGTLATTTNRTLDGKTDVMAAAAQETSYKATITDNNPPKLTFKHLLTKLEVSVKAKEDASALKWGKIQTIELVAIAGTTIKNNVEITLETGVGAFSGSASSFSFYSIDSEGKYTETPFANAGIDLPSTPAKLVAYSLIAPYDNVVGETPTKLKFKIVTEKTDPSSVEAEVSLPVSGDTQGRAYSITFTFDAVDNPILSSTTVIPWENSGGEEVEVN
jgi:hypothetical protein